VSIARRLHVLALALCAAPAWAHSPIKGIGNFYNGALHPFISPAHLIALLAFGLWLGQQGLSGAKRPLLAFVIALAAGLSLHRAAGDPDTDRWLLVLAALAGLAVAAALAVHWAAASAYGALAGLAVGLASGPSGIEGTARVVALTGTFFGASLACAYVAAMVTLGQRPWMRVVVRVFGSWLAAAALLVLALSFAAPRKSGVAEGMTIELLERRVCQCAWRAA
jgi:hydrogenase/urease accessory protein HupE